MYFIYYYSKFLGMLAFFLVVRKFSYYTYCLRKTNIYKLSRFLNWFFRQFRGKLRWLFSESGYTFCRRELGQASRTSYFHKTNTAKKHFLNNLMTVFKKLIINVFFWCVFDVWHSPLRGVLSVLRILIKYFKF